MNVPGGFSPVPTGPETEDETGTNFFWVSTRQATTRTEMGSSASKPAAKAPASPAPAELPLEPPAQPTTTSDSTMPTDSTSTLADPPPEGVIPRSKVDPYAELEKRGGAQNAEILRAYADTLPVSQVEAVMNQAQYRGIPMGIGTGIATCTFLLVPYLSCGLYTKANDWA